MPALLSINLNAVAMLRNRRDLPWPDLEHLGRLALRAGGHGLTVHPRPDQRHIRFTDVPILRALIDDEFPEAEYNIEGYPTDDFIALVKDNQPEQVTLVPDDPAQATSDHGWDFKNSHDILEPVVRDLKNAGFRVALFCDPDADREAVRIAAETGADRLELFTEPYAACLDDVAAAKIQINHLAQTAHYAEEFGLAVNAGHDLTVENLPMVAEALPQLAEVSIGHAMTAEALICGMEGAVRNFLVALGYNPPSNPA